jgi:hypothetical protein
MHRKRNPNHPEATISTSRYMPKPTLMTATQKGSYKDLEYANNHNDAADTTLSPKKDQGANLPKSNT